MIRATARPAPRRPLAGLGAALLAALALSGCQTSGSSGTAAARPDIADLPTGERVTPEDLFIVDCLLPGTARRLGTKLTYVTARRAIKTPAYDCARRGGEYSLPGQDSRQAAIAVWREAAEAGDPEAQTYLGEVYERGLGGPADPAAAARWYRKAADQGFARAQVNLAALYETGEGVGSNRRRAARLYAAASGLEPSVFERAQVDDAPAASAAPDPAIVAENARLRRELAETRGELDAARGRIAELTEARARESDRLDRLEGERRDLSARLSAARAEGSGAEGDIGAALAAKDAEIAAARARAEALTEALRAAQERAERKVAATESAVAERRETDRRAQELSRELAASRRALEAREAELAALVARERAANAEIEGLTAEQRRLADALDARAAAPDAEGDKAGELARLRAEVDALDRALDEKSGRVAALQSEIETVREKSAAELAEARRTAEALMAEREDRTAELAGELAEVRAERDRLSAALDSARSETAEQEARIASLAQERDTLEARLAETAETASEADRAEVARLERQITEREAALEESRARADRLETQLGQIRVAAGSVQRSAGTGTARGEAVDAEVRRFLAETRILFGDYHALVIGNSDFQHLPDLRTPGQDAEAVARVLRERYGFRVKVLLNATRYEILTALNAYYRTLTENDNFLLYYAGHGELDDVNDRGHWLPVDAEPDNRANWLSSQSITDQLNGMSVRKAIVIADSCYSGILTRAGITRIRPGMSGPALKQFLIAMADKRSRMVLSSGGVKPVLDGGGSGHSVFARAFLDALTENAEVLEGFTLYRKVAERVTLAAAQLRADQTPQYAPMRFAGHESGDFFFIPEEARVN